MTAATLTDAPIGVQWQSINWKAVEKNVKRLQKRIAKATNSRVFPEGTAL